MFRAISALDWPGAHYGAFGEVVVGGATMFSPRWAGDAVGRRKGF